MDEGGEVQARQLKLLPWLCNGQGE